MKNKTMDYICDDRLNEEMVGRDIEEMTDKEFEDFQKELKEKGNYPKKYYLA